MKILHTADWHIGKKLYTVSRIDEQRAVLDEIAALCDSRGIDVVTVAGDVYDTCNPSAEAEELFYTYAVRLARGRVFVAVAGNHDDPDRLSAADPLAQRLHIVLAGGGDLTSVRGDGFAGGCNSLTIERGGERLNLAMLPFPLEHRLPPEEKYDSYTDMVRAHLARGAACFGPGFNMVLAHLFTAGGETTDGDERVLGTACIVPNDVFPACDYTALGHVHKPMTVSASRRILYSGSILQYHFGDESEKCVVVIDTADGSFERVPLSAGKRLVRVSAATFPEALGRLSGVDGYAELLYSGEPLTPAETAALKDTPCVSVRVIPREADRQTVRREVLSDRELFAEFYKSRYGAENEKVTELFMRFIGGEDVTA